MAVLPTVSRHPSSLMSLCRWVEQNPALKARIKPLISQKRLIYKPLNSFYQVLSSEAYTKHGLNVHGVVFDELHAQPNRQLYDVMTKGSGDARKQPLYFLITTAGTDRHSICWEVHQKAEDILAGRKRDPSFLPCHLRERMRMKIGQMRKSGRRPILHLVLPLILKNFDLPATAPSKTLLRRISSGS